MTGGHEVLPATENVTVTVGTTSCVAAVAPSGTGGTGTCTILYNALSASVTAYTVGATYAGDTDLSTSTAATTTLTVNKDTTTTTVAVSPTSEKYGSEASAVFTVTVVTGGHEVLPATENVTVTVGTASCVASIAPSSNGGTGTCSIGNSALVGSGTAYTVGATYAGDTDLSTSTATTTSFTVSKATPAVTIAFTATPTVVGSTPITVQATVAGTGTVAPTGTISWTITGVTNPCTTPVTLVASGSNATASCTITNAGAAVYTFVATYNPGSDVNYVTAASTTYGAFFGGTSAGISNSSTNKYFAISSSSAGATTVGGVTSVKPTANSTLTTQYGTVAAAPGNGKTVTVSVLNTSSTVLMTCSTGNSTSCSVAGPVSVTSSTGLLIQATDSSGTASKVTWFVTFTQP